MLSRIVRSKLSNQRIFCQFVEGQVSRREIGNHITPCLAAININKSYLSTNSDSTATSTKKGLIERLFGDESNVASETFKSRWSMVLPAAAIHLCIGSPYAWSLMADAITREAGFVLPAASDWTLMQAALPLSFVFVAHGLSGALFGKWQLKVGTRKSMAAAACAFGSALMLGAAGIHYHSLPLLYIGYGLLGGTGIGLGYTPPVQTLMQWFPDKKGIASGLTIAGFGSGALVFTPCVQYLMKQFAKMPEHLGPAKDFVTQTIDGKLFASVNGSLIEVVNATAAELSKIPYALPEGLYVVGSGSTGAAEAMAVMGLSYFTIMMASALTIKRPHPNYTVAAPAATTTSPTAAALAPVPDISIEDVMKTPQFYQLGVSFCCVAMGGMGLFSVAKPMMSEIFSSVLPTVVTAAFASKFVLMLSSGNLGGRLGWAAVSDKIGRRNTFYILTMGSVPVYLAMPSMVDAVVGSSASGDALPLYAFCGVTMAALSGMGGVFAILPAYEADLFGAKFVSAIHGRMLLFSSIASVGGPSLLMQLRSISEKKAIDDLLSKITPEAFMNAFGAPMEKVNELMATKTLTISKLLAICPPGTIDPSPHLYDTTMYTLGGLMCVAVLSHAMVKPLKPTLTVQANSTSPVTSTLVETKVVTEEVVGDRQQK